MINSTARTSAAALLVLLTTSGALAQTAGSENPTPPDSPPAQAVARPARPKADHPTVSMPWWMQSSSIKVMPLGDTDLKTVAPQAKGDLLRLRVFMSKPEGPGLPVHAASADKAPRPSTITLSDGRILQRDGTITRDGEVVSRDTCINLPDGRTVAIADLLAKEKAAFNSDGTITLADGRIMKVEAGQPRESAPVPSIGAPGAPGARAAVPADADPSGTDNGLTPSRRVTLPRAKTTVRPTAVPAQAPR